MLRVKFMYMSTAFTCSSVSAYVLYKVGIYILCSLFVYKCYVVAHICLMVYGQLYIGYFHVFVQNVFQDFVS